MPPTEIPESHRDLLDAQVATLATIEPSGLPQMSEVWFLAEDGAVRMSLNSARRKTQNLEQRPECGLLILDLQNPYRYVELRGRARLEPDTDLAFARRMQEKYGGMDFVAHDQPGEQRMVVTVDPSRVRAVDMG
jgi:PPOX class probable F420-dependent enzyme